MNRTVLNRGGARSWCCAIMAGLVLLSWAWPVAAGEKQNIQSIAVPMGFTMGEMRVTPEGTVHIQGLSAVYMMLSDNPLTAGQLTVTGNFNGDLTVLAWPPVDPPAQNEKLIRREICKTTGLLPSHFSNQTTNEFFLAGTEPRENSADYFTTDGKLLLPDAYARWCGSRAAGTSQLPAASSGNERRRVLRPQAFHSCCSDSLTSYLFFFLPNSQANDNDLQQREF